MKKIVLISALSVILTFAYGTKKQCSCIRKTQHHFCLSRRFLHLDVSAYGATGAQHAKYGFFGKQLA